MGFLFKLLHGLLPTQDRILRLKIKWSDGICQNCNEASDSLIHAFFECDTSKEVGLNILECFSFKSDITWCYVPSIWRFIHFFSRSLEISNVAKIRFSQRINNEYENSHEDKCLFWLCLMITLFTFETQIVFHFWQRILSWLKS